MKPWLICAIVAALIPNAVQAQEHVHETAPTPAPRPVVLRFGAHAVGMLTHVSPILLGKSMTEGYITQPSLVADATALNGGVRLQATVSLEEFTLDRGELGAGSYGEGYVDRRHPHTLLHEFMLSGMRDAGPATLSASVGRGFAPFGTDDPMMRPFVKFPVNHHLGQILERLVLSGGVRTDRVMIEAGIFNGDEPVTTRSLGSLDRVGDSWAARATLFPLDGVEMQGSYAWLTSPENPDGIGWDQRKLSASARYQSPAAYVLAEWKRTTEIDRDVDLFSFGSVLLEAQFERAGWRPAIRLEQSERPEEERQNNPFRSPWPHTDTHVLGITRWRIASARIERTIAAGSMHVTPFIEGSRTDVKETSGGVFDPAEFYGDTRIWTLNLGARIGLGWHPSRMGRYGVAALSSGTAHSH